MADNFLRFMVLLPHRGSFVTVKKISEKKNVQKDVW